MEDVNYRLVCGEIVRFVHAAPDRINGRKTCKCSYWTRHVCNSTHASAPTAISTLQPISGEFDTRNYVGSISGTTINVPATFDERHRASIQALFLTDPTDDMQMIASRKDKLLDATDSWVLSNQAYLQWMGEDLSRVLWLHGDPGKGKTMLAIALVENFSKRLGNEGSASDSALFFFFCDNQDDRRNTPSHILRGLIYQAVCQRPELAIYFYNEYEKQGDQLFSSPNALQALWRIFNSIVQNSNLQEVLIVIDGLDECHSEAMEIFLVLLEPYVTPHEEDLGQSLQKETVCRLKWLLTSRNDLNIKQPLTGSLNISLEENFSYVNEAVFTFIDVKVKQLAKVKHYDDSLKASVENTLRQKAEGTFLWVALACRELSKPSVLSVNTEEVLSHLPSGITPLYTRIMDQVLNSGDERSTTYIKAILQSMIVAWRPLTLPELAIAAGLPKQYHHNLHVLGEYVEQCGSMVTIRHRQAHFVHLSAKSYLRQAQFVHLSARTHLLQTGRESIVSHDLGVEHRNIAINSFQYVCTAGSSTEPKDPSPTSSVIRRTSDHKKSQKEHVAYLEYPMLFWIDHARNASPDIAEQFDVREEFFEERSESRRAWFQAYWENTHGDSESCPSAFTAIHLAAYGGLSWLLSKLLDSGFEAGVHARDSLGNQPLMWAARNGHSSTVQLLLDQGANVAAKNNEGVTALYWAAYNGHASIISQLLSRGANCKPFDKIGWTPLHRAAFNGHGDVVRVLLNNGAEIEAMDGTKWTALMRAATVGNVEIAKLLLANHANVDVRDMEGCTPMHHAALNSHTHIVELCLEHGADFEARDNEGWTVIQHAAWNGSEKTVKYLLRKGANIHSKADNGWTALHQATWNGHTDVVGRLLKGGADPNDADAEGETALHQASWRGHAAVVKLLLKGDADTNRRDRTGQTALHQAASNGSAAVVQLLLSEGADPRIEDNDGRKPHSLAEENFHHSIAGILREHEAYLYGEEVLPDFENIPKTSLPDSHVDPTIISLLSADPDTAKIEPYGQAGFSAPSKISVVIDGKTNVYFMKTGPDGKMFAGEQSLDFPTPFPLLTYNRRARITHSHPLRSPFIVPS